MSEKNKKSKINKAIKQIQKNSSSVPVEKINEESQTNKEKNENNIQQISIKHLILNEKNEVNETLKVEINNNLNKNIEQENSTTDEIKKIIKFGKAYGNWLVQDEAVVGLAHRHKNLPCQDASHATNKPRTLLLVADGAGSSAVSEIGANFVVSGIARLVNTLDKNFNELLDTNVEPNLKAGRNMGLLIVKHAMGLLKDLANKHRREVRDFRCTFLMILVGEKRLLWIKVGDGALLVERMQCISDVKNSPENLDSLCTTLGEVGKGEFANITQFLDDINTEDVQIGLLDSHDVCGIAVMSDGAANKLVSNDGSTVSGRLSTLLNKLRFNKLHREELTMMFYEESFCHATVGDDCSIALASRGVSI